MQPLQITITSTTLVFNHLHDTGHMNLVEKLNLTYSEKGYFFKKDKPENLFKLLQELTYTYDIELS